MQGAIIALVSAFLGFFLSRCQSKSDRNRAGCDAFIGVVADMRAKLDELRKTPEKFFRDSLPILRQAIYRVHPFVTADQWACLQKHWSEYESQQQWFQSPGSVLMLMHHLAGPNARTPDGAPAPWKFLDGLLEKLYECVYQRAVKL